MKDSEKVEAKQKSEAGGGAFSLGLVLKEPNYLKSEALSTLPVWI